MPYGTPQNALEALAALRLAAGEPFAHKTTGAAWDADDVIDLGAGHDWLYVEVGCDADALVVANNDAEHTGDVGDGHPIYAFAARLIPVAGARYLHYVQVSASGTLRGAKLGGA